MRWAFCRAPPEPEYSASWFNGVNRGQMRREPEPWSPGLPDDDGVEGEQQGAKHLRELTPIKPGRLTWLIQLSRRLA